MYAGINHTYQTHSYAVRAPFDAPLRTTVTTLSSALYLAGGALFWLGYGDGFVYTSSRIVPIAPVSAGPSSPPLATSVYSSAVLVAAQGGVLAVDSAVDAPHDVSFYPAAGGPRVTVLSVPANRQVEYLGIDPASGELIRVEGEGPTYEVRRTYASPVSTASPLVSRYVAKAPRGTVDLQAVSLNAGYMFSGPAGPNAPPRLVRLADGAHWDIASDSEMALFVNRDYVWTAYVTSSRDWTFRRRPFPTSPPAPAEL